MGLNVKKGFRGRGIGSILLIHVMEWAKENLIIEKIELEVLANKKQAIRMYEKIGFLKEGVKKSAEKKDTGYIDLVIMGILLPR